MSDSTKKYQDLYLQEGQEHIENIDHSFLVLEKNPQSVKIIEEAMRTLHTLKSMSATMGFQETATLCHTAEDLLLAVKDKKIQLEAVIDLLFQTSDTLKATLKNISQNQGEKKVQALITKLAEATLDKQESKETADLVANPAAVEKLSSIQVKAEKLDVLMNQAEELLISKMRLQSVAETLDNPELKAVSESMTRIIADLQFQIMNSRLVPIGYIFNLFPRLVRDLAKKLEKEVNLVVEGGDIELDRTVIDRIGEPLIHLVRNALDHGLEKPNERIKQDKKREGLLKLTAQRIRDNIIIEISDDGAGLNEQEIKKTALAKGLIKESASKEEIINSIFSGISTSGQTTEVSGRGLGLVIVKKSLESLGGEIKIISLPGKGTKFTVQLPLTLAIIKSLFVKVAQGVYAIPIVNIERLVKIKHEEIKGLMENEAIVLDEENVPITRLDALFTGSSSKHDPQPIVIVRREEERFGLAVDGFLTTEEIVLKPLSAVAKTSRYFSSSTIIGSGEVILVLDITNIMLSRRIKS